MKVFISTFSVTFLVLSLESALACQIAPCPGWPSPRQRPQPPVERPSNSDVNVETTVDGAAITIRGKAATQLYKAMSDVRASQKVKTGEQITCRQNGTNTECNLEVGTRGQVFDIEQ